MIPIYEQGSGNGIGHTSSSFRGRFDEICRDHLQGKQARAFAFIFYNFEDVALRKMLKNQGVFAQLDRLAKNNLSIFYLHSGTAQAVERFNSEFYAKLGVTDEARPPCVVFFKLKDNKIEDVAVAQLESADIVNGFHELYSVIERYISNEANVFSINSTTLKWIKSGSAFLGVEVFRSALKKILEHLHQ